MHVADQDPQGKDDKPQADEHVVAATIRLARGAQEPEDDVLQQREQHDEKRQGKRLGTQEGVPFRYLRGEAKEQDQKSYADLRGKMGQPARCHPGEVAPAKDAQQVLQEGDVAEAWLERRCDLQAAGGIADGRQLAYAEIVRELVEQVGRKQALACKSVPREKR